MSKEFEEEFVFEPDSDFSEIPSHKAFKTLLLKVFAKHGLSTSQSVVEIGAGNGEYANFLNEKGFNVAVIEPSTSGMEIIRSRFPNLKVIACEPYDTFRKSLDPDKEYFYLSLEVIEHCFDPLLFLQSIYESMAPGEYLIISTPYHGYLKNLIIGILGKWDQHFTVSWKNGHIKFFSIPTLSELSKGAGFEVVETLGYGRIPFLWRGMFAVLRKP
ncbi:class I SAM-dependent methyltransferase [Litorivicinus sp.]|nr:class I SAM-dependent methyltransferase [Litorivicinus sp.]